MDAVIEAFGELTVASVIVCAAAIIYMKKLYNKWKKEVIEQHDTEKERDKKIYKMQKTLIKQLQPKE